MSTPPKALQAFESDNPELAQLEGLLSRFNLFEAIGVVRHEVRHSDFLAYLLNPSGNHGLDSTFLRELLQAVRWTIESDSPISVLDLERLSDNKFNVFREWHRFDILIIDDPNKLAVIIENKIDTGEHSDQLNRYYEECQKSYPDYEIIALYLTPDGDAPTSESYHAVSYMLICAVIEKLVQSNRTALDGEIIIVLEHYIQMLRRHIVGDPDIAELCLSIYQKHKQALDLIFKHRPDQQMQIKEFVISLIQQRPELSFNPKFGGKGCTPFGMKKWDNMPMKSGKHGGLLYFEFLEWGKGMMFSFTVGPGDQDDREKVLRMALANNFPNCRSVLTKSDKYCHVATIPFLSEGDYGKTQEEIEAVISKKWAILLEKYLPLMAEAISEEQWLWAVA